MAYIEHLKGRKYRLCATDPTKVGRKRVSRTVEVPEEIVKSERKTQQWLTLELAKYAEQVESGQLVKAEKLSFNDFIPQWKKGCADQVMGEYTRKNTIAAIDCYLVPEFGNSRIDQIKPIHLVTFLAELVRKDGKPMATNTKLNIYKAAKSIFDAAHEWKLIKENPIDGVKRPSIGKKEKKAMKAVKQHYSWDEVEMLLVALYALPTRWMLYFAGVMLGGFRRGEMLAVEWKNLDYDNAAIYVENQITYDEEGKKIESEVKTEESEAWVPMPHWYMDQLKKYEREWKKEKLQHKNWQGGDKNYIFHGGDGIMYFPSTPTNTWSRFLKKNKLPHVKLHGLRHTAGMLLRESGADLRTVQEQLRHARLETTTIYAHKSSSVSREAIDRLDGLNPKNRKIAP